MDKPLGAHEMPQSPEVADVEVPQPVEHAERSRPTQATETKEKHEARELPLAPVEQGERPNKSAPLPPPPQKDELTQEVESTLSAGLDAIYKTMDPGRRATFRRVGEQTAQSIVRMIKKGHVKASKILDLIKRWLKLIPGVNKFFLEQEAKIKTDAMVRIAEEEK